MDMDKLIQEESELSEKLGKVNDIRTESSVFKKERDSLNTKVKELSVNSKKVRTERDSLNKKVKAEKNLRDNLNKRIADLKAQFSKKYGNRSTSEQYKKLKKQIRDLEWKIETSGVGFEEEKKLRAKLAGLEDEKVAFQEEADSREELKNLERNAKKHHSNVIEFSKKSEQIHEKLVGIYKNLRDEREKANKKHEQFIAKVQELKDFEKGHTADFKRLGTLRSKIKDKQTKVKTVQKQKTETSFRERAEKAYEKFKAGKRVDLKELQIKFSLRKEKKHDSS